MGGSRVSISSGMLRFAIFYPQLLQPTWYFCICLAQGDDL
jgi:hypothetical protein